MADTKKGEILKFAANWLRDQAQTTHARRQAAQSRTAPGSTASAPPRSLLPADMPDFKDGIFDVDTAVRQASKYLR